MIELPQGEFDGEVLGKLSFVGRYWTGKIFTGNKVVNKIFGRQLIEGDVWLEGDQVIIHYPQLELTDRLTALDSTGDRWEGRMGNHVRFLLTRRVR